MKEIVKGFLFGVGFFLGNVVGAWLWHVL